MNIKKKGPLMSKTMHELEAELGAILGALRLTYRKISVMEGISTQFAVDAFGVIVCAINRLDYAIIDQALEKDYKGWRAVYVTTFDDINEKRYEIIWELMRSGYLTWLRQSVTDSQFRRLMFDGNLANKILEKRLSIWAEQPKYRYFIDSDTFAKGQGRISEFLSKEPGYFDYMPEQK
jgi:hypothetical protein